MVVASKPKRRNAARTKSRILEEAQHQFANAGYAQTGFRDIAQGADVAPSLLVQHFGSKPELFEAALFAAMDAQDIMAGDHADFGRRMANLIVRDADIQLPAMVVLSIGDADARAVCANIVRENMIKNLAKWLGPPHAAARAMSLLMILTGFVLYARLLPVGKVSPHTLAWMARTIQDVVDEH